jgi:hypothetical protein
VVVAGVVLLGVVVRLAAGHPTPDAQGIAQLSPATNRGASPSGHATPIFAPPTAAPSTPTATPSPTPTLRPTPTPTPTPLTILTPRLQGRAGGRSVTLLATTAPKTACTIVVGYSPPPQLGPATADGGGSVSWSWRVGSSVQDGTYPIQVSCGGTTRGAAIAVTGGGG